ncbi:MAG: CHAT domain-containing protein, partial [Desulfobacterales bacterium]|nr:CHAT domain-containing protein [Desulfobacterales bacterium]
MRCSRIIYTTLILLLLVFDAGADDARPWIDQGKEHFQAGRWEGAAMAWEKALERLDPEKDAGVYLDLVVHLANAWQSLGYYGKAFSLLREAAPVVEKKGGRRRYVQFLGGLGDLHLATGDVAGASKYLGKAVEEARLADNPRLLASALCDLGNLFASDRDYAGAISTYAEAVENARWAEDHGLEAEILINARHAAVQGDYPNEDVDLVMDLMERLPDSHEKAWNLIRLGLVASETRRRLSEEEKTVLENKLLHSAYNAFEKARRIAEGLGDWRTISHALGDMGRLYEEEKRWSEALALTRRAVFVARQGDYPQLLYKWQWRIGKISAALGAEKEAERAYRNAVSTLNPIRTELFTGWRDGRNRFDEEIRPVYLELTDLLLKRARAAGDDGARQGRLREARDVMEMLKTAELENFFDDECATMMDDRAASLDRAPPGVAVIYPIVFPQKIVLLLTLDDGVTHVETPVEAAAVKETALRLRHGLQHRMNNRFLYDAERLYDWIIRPIESTLAGRGVHTLVFAPDGALRLIPMSTLHDGKQFLVEKYALAVIPAITLLDPRPLDVENTRILLAGLSEARQGFSPLPSVPDELKDIRTIMDG